MHEADPDQGGASLEAMKSDCPAEWLERVFGRDEAPLDPIVWYRTTEFQQSSLKAIAVATLQATETYNTSAEPPELYLRGETTTEGLLLPSTV